MRSCTDIEWLSVQGARIPTDQVVAIALGSNLGTRVGYLARARERIAEEMGNLVGGSPIYETEPVGPPGQQRYLNQVLVLSTPEEPEVLVEQALAIETELGRRRGVRWGPRTIDLDLLLHGCRVRSGRRLTLPHPRLHERPFVLVPLAEVLPDWRHPLLGMTPREMLAAVGERGVGHWEGADRGQGS